jgi:hypothetical protein
MSEKFLFATRIVFFLLAWLFVVGIVIQVYLIGLSLFVTQSSLFTRRAILDIHIGLGHWIGILPLLMLALALLVRFPRPLKLQTGSLFALYLLQAQVFALTRQDAPVVAALHPVLALLLFILSLATARRSLNLITARSP